MFVFYALWLLRLKLHPWLIFKLLHNYKFLVTVKLLTQCTLKCIVRYNKLVGSSCGLDLRKTSATV